MTIIADFFLEPPQMTMEERNDNVYCLWREFGDDRTRDVAPITVTVIAAWERTGTTSASGLLEMEVLTRARGFNGQDEDDKKATIHSLPIEDHFVKSDDVLHEDAGDTNVSVNTILFLEDNSLSTLFFVRGGGMWLFVRVFARVLHCPETRHCGVPKARRRQRSNRTRSLNKEHPKPYELY